MTSSSGGQNGLYGPSDGPVAPAPSAVAVAVDAPPIQVTDNQNSTTITDKPITTDTASTATPSIPTKESSPSTAQKQTKSQSPSQSQSNPPPPSTPPQKHATIAMGQESGHVEFEKEGSSWMNPHYQIPGLSDAPATGDAANNSFNQDWTEAPSQNQVPTGENHDSIDHAMPDATSTTAQVPEIGDTAMQDHLMQLSTPQNNNVSNIDYFGPSTPYDPARIGQYDQQTPLTAHQQALYLMALGLPSLAPAANNMSPPPTVTPSQVTLPNPIEASYNLSEAMHVPLVNENKELESFARIEFADSVFQMTTYGVIIGRDQRALKQARRDEWRSGEINKQVEEHSKQGLPPPLRKEYNATRFSKSYVSEEGGMLGPESDNENDERPAKRRKTSTTGSSKDEKDEAQENMIMNRQYVSHTPGAAAVDLASLRPDPNITAFLGIHSPGPNIAAKTKAISRNHMKIEYNKRAGVFEAHTMHKNGFFCEDVHYKDGKVVLRSGDKLQVKDVDFTFIINGVALGCTGAEEEARTKPSRKQKGHGGKEMSFDFESSHANGTMHDTSDELSEPPSSPEISEFGEKEEGEEEEAGEEAEEGDEAEEGEEGEEDEEGEEGEDDVDAMETVEQADAEDESEQLDGSVEPSVSPAAAAFHATGAEGEIPSDLALLLPQFPKKRGPGRPPKNGIMSKREQRLLKKHQQEMAKKTLPQAPPMEPPIKRKVGRPRKHPLPEDGGDRPEKRKYKPRKPKNEDGGEGSDPERRSSQKKEKKTRPKSPPLQLEMKDYTEEQLQKPNKNYGVLIDETLTAAGPDGLTLKQIYKRICQRYPWFYFHTETKGWESSVRHNLIGNEAFRKDEELGVWFRVPGVELDAGKKRKATSPDRGMTAQAYGSYAYPYTAAQQLPPAAPGYPQGQTPHGYQVPAYTPQQAQQARPMQAYGASASPPGQPAPGVAAPPPAPAQLPPGYGPPPAPARPPLGVAQTGTYSSPYASRPPPPSNAAVKAEDGRSPPAPAPVQPIPAAVPGANPPVPGVAPISHPAAAPRPPPAAVPAAAPAPTRHVIEPRLLQAVVSLKNGLIENLKKARNPKSESIVMSALNRCIGLKKDATENENLEAICIKGIRQVIDGACKKSPTPGPGGSPAADGPAPMIDAKVLTSLNGFKDVSIKALSPRLGEAKAEAVTLSAIDRVLLLAEGSIIPPPSGGETAPGNFEGVEMHLMKSIRQLLTGMNMKLPEPAPKPERK